MSVYNGELFLASAIESILGQTFENFEFVIINDGSTDRSSEIIRSFNASQIQYFENDENLGLARSLNRGLSLARSKYIARMDADDISMPQRFAKQFQFLETYPEIGVVGSAVKIIDNQDVISEIRRYPESHEALKWRLCLSDPIPHPTVMMRRDVLENVGGYREEFTTAQDYDLWTRLCRITHLANLPEILLFLRRHDMNYTSIKFSQHRKNRVRVSQAMISYYLGKEVPAYIVQRIWDRDSKTVPEVRQAAEFVKKLCETGIARNGQNPRTQSDIRSRAADIILSLAAPFVRDGRAWDVLALACKIDQKVVLRGFGKLVRRYYK
jgi:glycosyltransferase involved in cell wall biosynthesis